MHVSIGQVRGCVCLVLAVFLSSSVAFSQVTGRIDAEVSEAVRLNQTERHVAGLKVNYLRVENISELLKMTTPVVATILDRASSVEAAKRDAILTYYIARVDNNILNRSLPLFKLTDLPEPLSSVEGLDPRATYVTFRVLGGSVTLNGVHVAMEPAQPRLSAGNEYLLFLTSSPDHAGAILRADGADCLRVEKDTLIAVAGRAVGPVASLSGETVSQAVSALISADH
jgi:hypothetical protein